ncbi:cytosine permease [Streptomyces sp. DHE17-7]|uniref:cytosine permease n=1 Tax=Streptomyces sp. DHE17-7 TaxID=2759949 RepID=UPI003FA6FA05
MWIGGDVVMGVLGRLVGLPQGGVAYAVVYGLLAAATVAGAVYGYRVLLAMSRVLAIGMTALLVLGLIAYAPDFTTAALPEAGGYLLAVPANLCWPRAAGLLRPNRHSINAARRLHPLHLPRPLLLPPGAARDLAG